MQKSSAALAALVGGGIIWGGTLLTRTDNIETDLGARSHIALSEAGFDSLKVNFSGRDATISGMSLGDEQDQLAKQLVEDVWGVRVARLDLSEVNDDSHADSSQAVEETPDAVSPEPETVVEETAPEQALSGHQEPVYEPKPEPLTDEALQEQLQQRFAASYFTEVDVRVEQREAYLSGRSPGVLQEERMLEIAQQTAGIEAVHKAFTNSQGELISEAEHAAAKRCALAIRNELSQGVINFEFASAEIDPQSFPMLDTLSGLVKQCPQSTVNVEGHTDAIGSAQDNMALSAKRAQSVGQYLISKGVPANMIVTRGYGASRPIADNQTAEGRAQNRRIEFSIVL